METLVSPREWKRRFGVKQIKLYGLGGQGVVTAAKVFAKAVAIGENRNALSVPAYGHERRGAPVYSDLIISDAPIMMRTFVYDPDVVVVFDLSVVEKGVDIMAGTTPETLFVLNTPSIAYDAPYRNNPTKFVDARSISLEVLKLDIPNTTMLGAMAGAGLCALGAVTDAIQSTFGARGAVNAQCAERGCNELQ